MTRLDELNYVAEKVGLHVASYSPGDGKTRYRFFTTPGNTYFGPDSGVYTAMGYGEANVFLAGWAMGWDRSCKLINENHA